MKTLKIKIIFFLTLFLFMSFISIGFNRAVISGSDLTIQASWLYETRDPFIDIDPHDWENKIKFSLGGEDLLDFRNHGVISVNDTEILIRSTVLFGFEVNAYTTVGYKDVFPEIDEDKEHSELFVEARIRRLEIDVLYERSYVNWLTIDLGDKDTHQYHEYDGVLPITIGIQDILPPSGQIVLNGIEFAIPKYTWNVIEVRTEKIRDGEAGAYMDIFTDASGIDEGTVRTETLGDDFSSSEDDVLGQVEDWDLGWKAGPIERAKNLQQSVIDSDESTHHSIPFEENTPFTFSLPITLHPEVYEYVQYNEIRRAIFDYWTWGFYQGEIHPIYGPKTEVAPKRIVAIHTSNYFLHWDLIAEIDFYATIPVTAELSESIMADPYLKRGDMVWDVSFTGAYDVTLPFTKQDPIADALDYITDMFGEYGWILILVILVGVGIYIFVQIGIPLITKKTAMRIIKR